MLIKATKWLILASLLLATGFVSAQTDPDGNIDTLSLVVENIADGNWMVTVSLWNDEELAALDIPLGYTAGIAKLRVDSISLADTRIEYFAHKYKQVDSLSQTLHFGGLAYMGPDKPPLNPGKGVIGKIYFSVAGGKKPGPFAVDTTLFGTNNHLMLVDRGANTIIPYVKIEMKKEMKKEEKK